MSKERTKKAEISKIILLNSWTSDYSEAESIASANNGRLPTKDDWTSVLTANPNAWKRFDKKPDKYGMSGETYWVGGRSGLSISGYFKPDYKKHRFIRATQAEWDKLPLEEKVSFHSGTGPVKLQVSVTTYDGTQWDTICFSSPTPPHEIDVLEARVAIIKIGNQQKSVKSLKRN